jgi:hypothetical protein
VISGISVAVETTFVAVGTAVAGVAVTAADGVMFRGAQAVINKARMRVTRIGVMIFFIRR